MKYSLWIVVRPPAVPAEVFLWFFSVSPNEWQHHALKYTVASFHFLTYSQFLFFIMHHVTSGVQTASLCNLFISQVYTGVVCTQVWIYFCFTFVDCWVLWRVSRGIQEFVKQKSYICTSTKRPWRDIFMSSQELFFSPVAWLLQRQLPGCCRCLLKVSVQCFMKQTVFWYMHNWLPTAYIDMCIESFSFTVFDLRVAWPWNLVCGILGY